MSGFADREWRSPDGLALYARDYPGAGGAARLPVICLHGVTRNGRDFEDVAPHLAAGGRRVLVPDVRGRGRSQWDLRPERYEPKVYARDVLALMDSLGIARAVFIGTSMGGLIMMALAALRSRAMAAAVLNDVGPEIGQAGLDRIRGYAGKPVDIATWDDAVEYARMTYSIAYPGLDDDEWERIARRTFRDEDGRPVLDYDPAIAQSFGRGPAKTKSLVASLLYRRLARKRPTLLVRGALSDIISSDIAGRMRKAAPALRVVAVPGTGHAPMLSEPAAAAAIDDFLAGVP